MSEREHLRVARDAGADGSVETDLIYGDAWLNAQRASDLKRIVAEFDALDYRKQRAVNVHALVERLRSILSVEDE